MALSRRQRLDLLLFGALATLALGLLLRGLYAARPPEIDLLKSVDVRRDAVEGLWVREGTSIVSPKTPWARLRLGVVPPEEYDLELRVSRRSGHDSLNLGLSDGRRRFMIILDGEEGSASWIDRAMGGASRRVGKLFVGSELRTVEVSVRRERVSARVDGTGVLDWKGEAGALGLEPSWNVGAGAELFLGAFDSAYEIRSASLRPWVRE